MKQAITKEQLDELSKEQQIRFWHELGIKADPDVWQPEPQTIGQMIEFLGDDLDEITNTEDWCDEYKKEYDVQDFDWHIQLKGERRFIGTEDEIRCESGCCGQFFVAKELVDALWEAVKYKLNK